MTCRNGVGLFVSLALVAALTACGQGQQRAEKAPPRPAVHADGFDPAGLDVNRPCTLLSHADAERIFPGQPFYRTIAADRVEQDRVRCAHGVGAGGLHAIIEAAFLLPEESRSAELAYVALCRAEEIAGPQPEPSEAGKQGTTGEGPHVSGRSCRLANGGYAILMADRVLIALVRGGAGEVNPAASQRLAAILSRRVAVPAR